MNHIKIIDIPETIRKLQENQILMNYLVTANRGQGYYVSRFVKQEFEKTIKIREKLMADLKSLNISINQHGSQK